jgi:hypothetical protein
MNEPPILPPGDERHAPSASDDDVNPFAPSAVAAEEVDIAVAGTIHLPAEFWAVLAVAFIAFTGLTFVGSFGLGIPALLALSAAAVRVPLLQRRLTRGRVSGHIPSPIMLLLTSWAIMLATGFASCIAFCAICLPSGYVAIAIDSTESFLVPMVFGFSGLAGLAAFIFLFYWSLRLPV